MSKIEEIHDENKSPYKKRVLLCVMAHENKIHTDCFASIIFTREQLENDGIIMDIHFAQIGGNIGDPRNIAISSMIASEGKYSHIIFVDSNFSWGKNTIAGMIKCDKDVVCVAVMSGDYKFELLCANQIQSNIDMVRKILNSKDSEKNDGKSDGKNDVKNDGKSEGKNDGKSDGKSVGKSEGKNDGKDDGKEIQQVADKLIADTKAKLLNYQVQLFDKNAEIDGNLIRVKSANLGFLSLKYSAVVKLAQESAKKQYFIGRSNVPIVPLFETKIKNSLLVPADESFCKKCRKLNIRIYANFAEALVVYSPDLCTQGLLYSALITSKEFNNAISTSPTSQSSSSLPSSRSSSSSSSPNPPNPQSSSSLPSSSQSSSSSSSPNPPNPQSSSSLPSSSQSSSSSNLPSSSQSSTSGH